jgi:hypothetical protein
VRPGQFGEYLNLGGGGGRSEDAGGSYEMRNFNIYSSPMYY